MQNAAISTKILAIIGGLGLLGIGSSFYSGLAMTSIDTDYSHLIAREQAAVISLARSNRAFQTARAAIGDVVMLVDKDSVAKAEKEFSSARQSVESYLNEAVTADPANKNLQNLKQKALALLDNDCSKTLEQGRNTQSAEEVALAIAEFNESCQPGFPALSQEMVLENQRLMDLALDSSDRLSEETLAASRQSLIIMFASTLLALACAYLAVRGWVTRPLQRLASSMQQIAGGDYSATVEGLDRKDEVGGMALAVQVFKDNGLRARSLEAETEAMKREVENQRNAEAARIAQEAEDLRFATLELGNSLRKLSAGDLTCQIHAAFASDYEPLRHDFNSSVDQLSEIVGQIFHAIENMESGTAEIAAGADDLSRRTEQQAASLEETAAALDQITVNLSSSSKLTAQVRDVTEAANQSALKSAEVVGHAENAMQRIEESSTQISNIIGVIDEIAFQTNLLALNAGVEAARAGEAGKGFAVVAQEVRELAQRSAQAAKEIKGLIEKSSNEVAGGVDLVRGASSALGTIGDYIADINRHVRSIATSAEEQSSGLMQINAAVNQMDQSTQQNAAMVEESNAAASSLSLEARRLKGLVARFRLSTREGFSRAA